MKKLFQLLVVFALVVTVIGVAMSNPVWASPCAGADLTGANAPLQTRIIIAGSGGYNVGGVCTLDVQFKDDTKLQLKADAEIPIMESSKVPFFGLGELFYPGCHLVHVKQDQVIRELSATEDGTAKVCFGANPEMQMRIYYYLDQPFTTSPAWAELATTLEDNGRLICASAPYTGVYMPAGKIIPVPGSVIQGINLPIQIPGKGSVIPPSSTSLITESGTYAAGGICMLKVKYRISGLSNILHVEPEKQDTNIIPFFNAANTNNTDLIYFPGCHVEHFRDARIDVKGMTRQDGDWEICFAERPGKTMTIYYYKYYDDQHLYENPDFLAGPWEPLVTTTENGLSCAGLVDFTAVYAPAGR